jgi:hypothetical protein
VLLLLLLLLAHVNLSLAGAAAAGGDEHAREVSHADSSTAIAIEGSNIVRRRCAPRFRALATLLADNLALRRRTR